MNSKVLKYGGFLLAGVVVLVVVVVILVLLEKKSNESSNSKGTRVTDSLKFITVISRHGNRGAKADYATDPYPINDTKFWPYGSFRLTPKGRVEMYKLGQKIRSMYKGFLNSTFYPAELHASSTYLDRMLMSGEMFLAGLYPPQGFQLWNKNIPWQPTPIYSDNPDHTAVVTSCPKYVKTGLVLKTALFEKYATNYSEILSYYNNVTGANLTGWAGDSFVWYLWDKVISEETEGYKIPDWLKKIYPKKMEPLVANLYILYNAGTVEMVRLLIGNMFEEIVGVMESVVNGTLPDRRVQYYSGHDSTIVAMQVLLGIPQSSVQGMIKPGSGMVLELHQNSTTDKYTIQVLYMDGSSSDLEPVPVNIPYTDFSTIVNNTQQYMGVNYDLECQLNNSALYLQHYDRSIDFFPS